MGMKGLQDTCALLEYNTKEGVWSEEMLPEAREVRCTPDGSLEGAVLSHWPAVQTGLKGPPFRVVCTGLQC